MLCYTGCDWTDPHHEDPLVRTCGGCYQCCGDFGYCTEKTYRCK